MPPPPLLVVSIAFTLLVSPCALGGSIECYCNSAQCTADGRYVCTSATGRCFSKLYSAYRAASTVHPTRLPPPDEHGCVDLLPAPLRGMCPGTGDLVKQTEKGNAMIVCCGDELCNYNKHQDIRVDSDRDGNSAGRRSSGGGGAGTPAKEKSQPKSTEYARPTQDTWFTVAIVCVPIVGGLILVVLILVAVRMLRSDQLTHKHGRHGSGGSSSGGPTLGRQKLCWPDGLPWRQGKRALSDLALSDRIRSSDVYKDVSVQVGHWLNGVSVHSLSAESAAEEVCSSVLVWNDQSVSAERTSGIAAAV